MINVRNFNENPLLSNVRYKLGKALLGKIYYKTEEGFEILDDETLNKIEDLDPHVYYGVYLKKDDNNCDISFEKDYINFAELISLIVLLENEDKGLRSFSFLEKEVFDYLEYREHVTSLIEYYLHIRASVDFELKSEDIFK